MADVVFVLITIAFFALSAAFVVGCDRLIGPDDGPVTSDASPAESEDLAA